MDRTHIDDHHVIDRYVQGALDDEELQAFERYILDHPDIIEDIEYARAMRSAMARNAALLAADPAAETGARPIRTGFLFGRSYAIAATVLLAAAIPVTGYLVNDLRELRGNLRFQDLPSRVSSEIVLEQTRGAGARTFPFPEEGALLLRADVGPEHYEAYDIALTSESGYEWTGSGLAADAARTIGIFVPQLDPGTYTLVVTAESPSGSTRPVARYRFVVDSQYR